MSKNTNALKTGAPACLESLQNSPQDYTFVPLPIRPHSFRASGHARTRVIPTKWTPNRRPPCPPQKTYTALIERFRPAIVRGRVHPSLSWRAQPSRARERVARSGRMLRQFSREGAMS